MADGEPLALVDKSSDPHADKPARVDTPPTPALTSFPHASESAMTVTVMCEAGNVVGETGVGGEQSSAAEGKHNVTPCIMSGDEATQHIDAYLQPAGLTFTERFDTMAANLGCFNATCLGCPLCVETCTIKLRTTCRIMGNTYN